MTDSGKNNIDKAKDVTMKLPKAGIPRRDDTNGGIKVAMA
jgi:hypothetical protein